MQMNEFDEIVIEKNFEHIYGFKDCEAIEIVPPHSKDFKEKQNNLKLDNYMIVNDTEQETRLVRSV